MRQPCKHPQPPVENNCCTAVAHLAREVADLCHGGIPEEPRADVVYSCWDYLGDANHWMEERGVSRTPMPPSHGDTQWNAHSRLSYTVVATPDTESSLRIGKEGIKRHFPDHGGRNLTNSVGFQVV
jgi:hypothetical protein